MANGRTRKRWNVDRVPHDAAALALELGVETLTAVILLGRGVSDADSAQRYLHPSFDHLPDAMLLPDCDAAVRRIARAIEAGERIYVHGDYDADGVTSAALWVRLLTAMKADVRAHVPHRRDGYDIRQPFVERAAAEGAKLIITVDCGIQRRSEIARATELGIDTVITDHHEPGGELPRAVAVVNPHRSDSPYPFQHLAGVGVAYRVGEALVRLMGMPVASYLSAYADLAAIGTVADVMPIREDNRVIVKAGLRTLAVTRKQGLQAMMRTARIPTNTPLTPYVLGFQIGPRLNAAGRVDEPARALELLLTRDTSEAAALAEEIEGANVQRKEEEASILERALAQLNARDISEERVIVLADEGWNPGVIGLVAGRIAERYHRPTAVINLGPDGGRGKGSARSIRPFDLYSAMCRCREHLGEFGGHSHAAGFSIERGSIAGFRDAMNSVAQEVLSDEDMVPEVHADCEVDPDDINAKLMRELAELEPFGHDNEAPVFVARGMRVDSAKQVGKENQHLRLGLRSPGGDIRTAMLWREGALFGQIPVGRSIDIAFRPKVNEYNHQTSIDFVVQDLRPSED